MANHSILLKKTEEDRLYELYQTKCDEVSPFISYQFSTERLHGLHPVHPVRS